MDTKSLIVKAWTQINMTNVKYGMAFLYLHIGCVMSMLLIIKNVVEIFVLPLRISIFKALEVK